MTYISRFSSTHYFVNFLLHAMSRFQELTVYCLVAMVISGTDGLQISPRYMMNVMDPCHGRCKQGHCSQAGMNNFKCACFDGWAGADCDVLAWTLTTAPANSGSHNLVAFCNHHGTWNGYSCVCLDNWSGDRCQFAPTGYQNPDGRCSNHGHWDGFKCHCRDHWTGDHCQYAPVETTPDSCNGQCVHGHCEPVYNMGYVVSYQCRCDYSWHGDHCDQQYTSTVATTLDNCHNHCVHGHCVMDYDRYGQVYYRCRCDNRWHGVHCTEQYTSSDPCFDNCVNGRCEPSHWYDGQQTFYCQCDPSWQGVNCDTGAPKLHCGHSYCMHGSCVTIGYQNSHCECYYGWQGQTCEESSIHTTVAPTQMLETSPTSTTQIPTTSPSTVLMTSPTTEPSTVTTTTQTLQPVTPTSPHHSSSTMIAVTSAMTTQVPCNKLSTLIDISQQTQADNQNASLCPSGFHTSHEAFVLKNCLASQNPANWQPGVEVMTMCSGGVSSVPDYTAIAAFENGRYAAVGGLSGILVGCLDDGFKMAVQRCDQPPHIVDIHAGGANLDNPNAYFAIV